MRKNQAFRPRVSESLEARAVPTVGVATPTGLFNITVTLPSQLATGNTQVQAAFAAFDKSFIHAVDAVLLAPGPGGLVVPSANRAAFDAAIEASLDTLAADLIRSLGTSSTNSTAATQVTAAIVGPGQASLESQLLELSVGSISSLASPLTTSLPGPSSPVSLTTSVGTVEQVRPTLRPPIAPTAASATSLVGDAASSPGAAQQAPRDVRDAFGSFLNDYFQAVRGVLLAPDATGQVNPKANRAAFDARVGQALQSLDASLSATLGRSPATSALGPQVRAAIEGGGSSLKNQLAGLPTPSGPQAEVVRSFTLGSVQTVAQMLSLISADVSKALPAAAAQ